MGLEAATNISGLNANWPLGTDPKAQGDDHLRLLKAVLKATFPPGWDTKTIQALLHENVPAVTGGSGSAADLTTTSAVIATTPNFTATGRNFFAVMTARAGVTSLAAGAAIGAVCGVQLRCVTDADAFVGEVTDNASFHNQQAVAMTASNVMKFTAQPLWGTEIGKVYRMQLFAFKTLATPVTPLGDIKVWGHNLS